MHETTGIYRATSVIRSCGAALFEATPENCVQYRDWPFTDECCDFRKKIKEEVEQSFLFSLCHSEGMVTCFKDQYTLI